MKKINVLFAAIAALVLIVAFALSAVMAEKKYNELEANFKALETAYEGTRELVTKIIMPVVEEMNQFGQNQIGESWIDFMDQIESDYSLVMDEIEEKYIKYFDQFK
jgi:hypothetical protein